MQRNSLNLNVLKLCIATIHFKSVKQPLVHNGYSSTNPFHHIIPSF